MKFNQLRRLITIAMVVSVSVLFISTDGMAFPPGIERPDKAKQGHHRPPCPIWKDLGIIERLEITPEQVKAFQDADYAFRESHLELEAQCDLLHLQLEKAFSEETADEASIQKVAQKLADVKRKIFLQDILFRLKMDKILTPKQRSKLRSLECMGRPPGGPHPERPNRPYPQHP